MADVSRHRLDHQRSAILAEHTVIERYATSVFLMLLCLLMFLLPSVPEVNHSIPGELERNGNTVNVKTGND